MAQPATYTNLADALKGLPEGVTTLDLGLNYLGYRHGTELTISFAAIPQTVTSLNLRENCLYKITSAELTEIFKTIPPSVTSLDLSGNSLYKVKNTELAKAFKAIPSSVTSLNLSGNVLNELLQNTIEQLKDSLPQLKTVYLRYGEVKAMNSDQRKALRAAFKNIQDVILVDNEGNELKNAESLLLTHCTWELGDKHNVPSLLSQCAFYARKNFIDTASTPTEVQNIVKTFPMHW